MPPTRGQPQSGSFFLANSDEFTFHEVDANSAAIEAEIARTKEVVAKQPREARRLGWLARWFPHHGADIAQWQSANGKSAGTSAGRPLDDDLPYELGLFEAWMRSGKFKSSRKAAIALWGEDRARSFLTKWSIFGRAYELWRKPHIVYGPRHSKRRKP